MHIDLEQAQKISLKIKQRPSKFKTRTLFKESVQYLQGQNIPRDWFPEEVYRDILKLLSNPPKSPRLSARSFATLVHNTVYTLSQICPPLTLNEEEVLREILLKKYRVSFSTTDYLLAWYKHGGYHSLARADVPHRPIAKRDRIRKLIQYKFPRDPHPLVQRLSTLYELCYNGFLSKSRKPRETHKKSREVFLTESPLMEKTCGTNYQEATTSLLRDSFEETLITVQKYLTVINIFNCGTSCIAEILPVLPKLSDKYQSLFSCIYLKRMLQKDVSKETGITQGAISHRLQQMCKKVAFYLYFKEFSPEYLIENLSKVYPNDDLGEKSTVLTLAIHLSTGCKQTHTSTLTGVSQCMISNTMSKLFVKVSSMDNLGKFKEMIQVIQKNGYILQDVNFDSKYDWSTFVKKEPLAKGIQDILRS